MASFKLDPFDLSPQAWCYDVRGALEVYFIEGPGTIAVRNVKLPVKKLVEALRLLGYRVQAPPRKRPQAKK